MYVFQNKEMFNYRLEGETKLKVHESFFYFAGKTEGAVLNRETAKQCIFC